MKRTLYLYYCSVVFVILPVYAARPMTSLFAEELGASMVEIGLLTSCFSLVPLLTAIASGQLIDRFGEKIPLMIGSGGMVLALSFPFFQPSLFFLFMMQFLLGGSQIIAIVAIQNGVSSSAPLKQRDQAVANFSLFSSLGILIGPLVGGYLTEHFGFQNTYIVLSVISVVSLITAFIISPSRKLEDCSNESSGGKVRELLSIPGFKLVLVVSMLSLSALDIFYAYFPLYASSIGMSLTQIGWILSIQALANAVTRMFLSPCVERFGRTHVLIFFMVLGALGFALVPLYDTFLYVALISIFLGMGLGIIQPLTTILTYNLAPKGRTGEALGVRFAGNRMGQITIPLIFAGVSTLTSLGAIFIIVAAVLFIGAWSARGILSHDKIKQNT